MATLALFAAGSAIGSSMSLVGIGIFSSVTSTMVGGMIGGIVGGYIDQTYLLPAVFGKSRSVYGPSVERQASSASEGTPIPYFLGPECRVDGQIIWKSSIRTVNVTTESGGGGKGGGGGGSVSTTTPHYYQDVAIAFGRKQADAVREIWLGNKKVYDNGTLDPVIEDINIYLGTNSQGVDPVIDAATGGRTSAYRGTCYVVLKNVHLNPLGSFLPPCRGIIEQTDSLAVADAIIALCQRSGLTLDEIDVSKIRQNCLRGYVLAGPTSGIAALEPILLTYNLSARESNGKLVFFERGYEDEVPVKNSDLAAHEPNASYRSPYITTDVSEFDVPTELNVQFVDSTKGYQRGSTRQRSGISGRFKAASMDLPLVVSSAFARQVAARVLYSSHGERQGREISLPHWYIHTEEGDRLIQENGDEVVLSRVEVGANYQLLTKGVIAETEDYRWICPGEDDSTFNPNQYVPPAVTLEIMDLPALRAEDVDKAGFYYALCATSYSAAWRGATVYDSPTNSSYSTVASVSAESTIGVCENAFSSGPTEHWDEITTIDVTLLDGSLTPATKEEVYAGANHACVGQEIIAFRNVEDIAPRKVRLSGLLRGVRDTPTTGHIGFERFVLLNESSVYFSEKSTGVVGQNRWFKGVSSGKDPGTVTPIQVQLNGETLRPFAVCHVKGDRLSSPGDLVISWVRRTRAPFRLLGTSSPPLSEEFERYEIEITDGFGTVLRTVTVDDSTSFTYTSAMASADFLSIGSPITVRIYQISSVVGRGHVKETVV